MKQELTKIVKPIVNWYQSQEKTLPWKQDKEPYHVWVSEIMLQQTRIEAVRKYYARFMQELPTIQDLANVSEEKLLKLWEGLGYYSRARNLKKAAIQIENDYQGKMPTSYLELLKLSGIGEYTAGAIASISYQEKVPAVDGNVLRVISRVLASKEDVLLPETKRKITKKLLEIMPEEAGDFNEGLMELGEKICIPNTTPLCEKCPIKEFCIAKKENLTTKLPIRIKKQKRKIRRFYAQNVRRASRFLRGHALFAARRSRRQRKVLRGSPGKDPGADNTGSRLRPQNCIRLFSYAPGYAGSAGHHMCNRTARRSRLCPLLPS